MDWGLIRFGIFLFGLLLFMTLGFLFPRRKQVPFGWSRIAHNLLLGGINPLILRLFFSWGLVEWALWLKESGWGLLNWLPLPDVLSVILMVIVFDGVIYWQHRLTHRVPWLWRLHRVHHSDPGFDTTTALRFHTVEIVFSLFVKIGTLSLLGGPAAGIFIFEVLLNFSAMFNHSNLNLPIHLDSLIRRFLVTPDFHRVHHSPIVEETNSNYGFCLSIWDYLFSTYREQPRKGHLAMEIGLDVFRDKDQQAFWQLLGQPLRKK